MHSYLLDLALHFRETLSLPNFPGQKMLIYLVNLFTPMALCFPHLRSLFHPRPNGNPINPSFCPILVCNFLKNLGFRFLSRARGNGRWYSKNRRVIKFVEKKSRLPTFFSPSYTKIEGLCCSLRG